MTSKAAYVQPSPSNTPLSPRLKRVSLLPTPDIQHLTSEVTTSASASASMSAC